MQVTTNAWQVCDIEDDFSWHFIKIQVELTNVLITEDTREVLHTADRSVVFKPIMTN